jgi:hypothetical protein
VLGADRVWWPLLLAAAALLALLIAALSLVVAPAPERRSAIRLAVTRGVPPRSLRCRERWRRTRGRLLESGEMNYYSLATLVLRVYADRGREPGWAADLTTSELAAPGCGHLAGGTRRCAARMLGAPTWSSSRAHRPAQAVRSSDWRAGADVGRSASPWSGTLHRRRRDRHLAEGA